MVCAMIHMNTSHYNWKCMKINGELNCAINMGSVGGTIVILTMPHQKYPSL